MISYGSPPLPIQNAWRFPEKGLLPVLIGFGAVFHEINHPASLGYPHDELETSKLTIINHYEPS